jgi:hypothetical protein
MSRKRCGEIMKARISAIGELVITADEETEQYALSQWIKNNYVRPIDESNGQNGYFKGTSIAISCGAIPDMCGVITNDSPPVIGGLDKVTHYKGVFVSSDGAKLWVDSISDEFGSVSVVTSVGVVSRGDVVKLRRD